MARHPTRDYIPPGPPEGYYGEKVEGCDDCEGVTEADAETCPESQKACLHHCNHAWSHDVCCWCGKEWGESGAPPERIPEKPPKFGDRRGRARLS